MSQPANSIKTAVVGCGHRGRYHLNILRDCVRADTIAVCDPASEARDRVGDEFGIQNRYATVEALLDAETLDAVIVATPAHLNARLATPFIKQGIHTLLEKPPGMAVKETRALRDAAVKSGAKVMVGWNRRFNPVILHARALIEERGPVALPAANLDEAVKTMELIERIIGRTED